MKKRHKNNVVKNIFIVLIGIVVLSAVAFTIWANDTYEPTADALAELKDEKVVDIIKDNFISFIPKDKEVTKGFIFYPGGKVEPEAYAELCKGIAKEGYLVVIVPMPLDLAVLSPNKAEDVIDRYDYIDTWAIGGHSLGGVMASSFASNNDKVKAVAFYASYPSGDELKNKNIKVLSIYGSNDGIANIEKIKNADLPQGSNIIEIKGGNHAQFGEYGKQDGDKDATISNNNQIGEAIKYTVEMMKGL